MRIGIQGQKGSNHHLLARKMLGDDDVEIIPALSFPEEAQMLLDDKIDIALMAVENSIVGSIRENLDLLSKNSFEVIGEGYLRIEHCLIGLEDAKLEDIKIVYSHEMALKQCMEYLDSRGIEAREYHDTAAAVPHILELNRKEVAAIAPAVASEVYGGNLLERGIETNKENYTRFVFVVRKDQIAERAWLKSKLEIEEYKTMLVFRVTHEPGSLVKSLQVLYTAGLNLSKIESRPIVGEAWRYRFYVDFLTSKDPTSQMDTILKNLAPYASNIELIGTFPAGKLYTP